MCLQIGPLCFDLKVFCFFDVVLLWHRLYFYEIPSVCVTGTEAEGDPPPLTQFAH